MNALAVPVRTSIVRTLAERRQVFEHREELDHLLGVVEAETGPRARLAFHRALSVAALANRRPDPR